MCPSEGRDVRQKLLREILTGAFSCHSCLSEIFCIPVDDDGCQQVEAGHAIVLPLRGSVTYFALTPDAQGVFQGVMGLTLIVALHIATNAKTPDLKTPTVSPPIFH
jgi:hypothetical protein